MVADRNASAAAIAAIAIAVFAAHRTPSRLMTTNTTMIRHARSGTEVPGRNHWLIADAETSAVSPQVGIQPHQYATPVRLPSTGAYGRNASPQVAAIPPTRSGHIMMSS